MPYLLFAVIPAIGHINPLLQQAKELQRRGWRVAIATTEERRSAVEPQIPFVSLGTIPPDLVRKLESEVMYASEAPNLLQAMLRSTRLLVDALWPTLFDGLVAAIRADRPDLMVVDQATVAGYDAAEAEGIPFVVNNPDLLCLLPHTLMPPAYDIPLPFSGVSLHAMTPLRRFAHRILAPILWAGAGMLHKDLNRRFNACRHSRGLPPTDFRYRLKDKVIMTNCAFPLEYPRALPPFIHMVGPMLPDAIEALPDEYRDWLSSGPPVVYVNLGTIALPPPAQFRKMLDAFRSDSFRVLWILRNEAENVPANVRIESWGPPPRAILAHGNVKVFVSHCGINSVHESLQAGTPIVGIPMLADQQDMAMRVQDAGVGIMLNKTRFTTEELRQAIERVMRDAAFRAPIGAIRESFRKAGGIARAADLIEARRG
jgi:UDP:flavonoid glycosyltransferase YjiC (YdhE family)